MFGIPSVIFVVVIAVLIFMYIKNKGKNTASGSSIESVNAQKLTPDPEVDTSEISNVAEAIVSEAVAAKEPEASIIADDSVDSRPVSSIPEDSTLRRHFIQQLTTEIEATLPVRPSDSALIRHYDAQLLSLVGSKLDALK